MADPQGGRYMLGLMKIVLGKACKPLVVVCDLS